MMRYRTKGSFKGKGIMAVGDERSLCGEGGDRSQERKSSPRRPKHELLAVNGQVTARCIQPSSTRVQSGRGGQHEYMQDIQHSLNVRAGILAVGRGVCYITILLGPKI